MILRVARRSSAVYSPRGVFVAAWLECNRSPHVVALRQSSRRDCRAASLELEAEPAAGARDAAVARRQIGIGDVIEQRRDTDNRVDLIAELDTFPEQDARAEQLLPRRRDSAGQH